MGAERLVGLYEACGGDTTESAPDVYVVAVGETAFGAGVKAAENLRDAMPGLRVELNLGGGSFKAQFKRADRSGAPLAVVLGEDELDNRVATVKHLREQKPQEQVSFDRLDGWLNDWLDANG